MAQSCGQAQCIAVDQGILQSEGSQPEGEECGKWSPSRHAKGSRPSGWRTGHCCLKIARLGERRAALPARHQQRLEVPVLRKDCGHMRGKYQKREVGYERPAKGPNHCSECKHFLARQEACEIVEGRILPGDWCKKFERGRESWLKQRLTYS